MSKNVILVDKNNEQTAPATIAEQVQWDNTKNLKQYLNELEQRIKALEKK